MTATNKRETHIGLEATPGDAVTPSIVWRALVDLKAVADKRIVEEHVGSLAPLSYYLASLKAEGNASTPQALYQQSPYMISMAMGQVTPTGTDPYTWNWPWPHETSPTFATFTVEYMDEQSGNWCVKADDVFATGLTISGEAEGSWAMEAPLVGGTVTYPTSFTDPAAPVDTTITVIRVADTQLWMDDAWADLGSTEVEAAFINFSWKLENLQHQKMFAGSLYPQGRGNDKWAITLDMTLEVANAIALAERAKLLSDVTETSIRIKASTTPYTGITWSATIDGVYYLNDVATLDDRDGNNIIALQYIGILDADENQGSVEIVNDMSALTAAGEYFYE